jgi:hypothetical protein
MAARIVCIVYQLEPPLLVAQNNNTVLFISIRFSVEAISFCILRLPLMHEYPDLEFRDIEHTRPFDYNLPLFSPVSV